MDSIQIETDLQLARRLHRQLNGSSSHLASNSPSLASNSDVQFNFNDATVEQRELAATARRKSSSVNETLLPIMETIQMQLDGQIAAYLSKEGNDDAVFTDDKTCTSLRSSDKATSGPAPPVKDAMSTAAQLAGERQRRLTQNTRVTRGKVHPAAATAPSSSSSSSSANRRHRDAISNPSGQPVPDTSSLSSLFYSYLRIIDDQEPTRRHLAAAAGDSSTTNYTEDLSGIDQSVDFPPRSSMELLDIMMRYASSAVSDYVASHSQGLISKPLSEQLVSVAESMLRNAIQNSMFDNDSAAVYTSVANYLNSFASEINDDDDSGMFINNNNDDQVIIISDDEDDNSGFFGGRYSSRGRGDSSSGRGDSSRGGGESSSCEGDSSSLSESSSQGQDDHIVSDSSSANNTSDEDDDSDSDSSELRDSSLFTYAEFTLNDSSSSSSESNGHNYYHGELHPASSDSEEDPPVTGNPSIISSIISGISSLSTAMNYEDLIRMDDNLPENGGLPRKLFRKIPIHKYKGGDREADTVCNICMSTFTVNVCKVRKLPCLHTYHAKCIDPWLKRKYTCPVCRDNVKTSIE